MNDIEEPAIFCVVTVPSKGDKSGIGAGSRLVGYFHSFEEAKQCVSENWGDIFEYYYRYAVIEETPPGLYPPCKEHWFEWNKESKGYVPCAKPEEFANIVAFGVG